VNQACNIHTNWDCFTFPTCRNDHTQHTSYLPTPNHLRLKWYYWHEIHAIDTTKVIFLCSKTTMQMYLRIRRVGMQNGTSHSSVRKSLHWHYILFNAEVHCKNTVNVTTKCSEGHLNVCHSLFLWMSLQISLLHCSDIHDAVTTNSEYCGRAFHC